jgi:hypothetical protein
MHEVRAVTNALERALVQYGAHAMRGGVRLVIQDPLRAEKDAAAFYAVETLRLHGISDAAVSVNVELVRCTECGIRGRPRPTDPVCHACGSPFRPSEGPAVRVELMG